MQKHTRKLSVECVLKRYQVVDKKSEAESWLVARKIREFVAVVFFTVDSCHGFFELDSRSEFGS